MATHPTTSWLQLSRHTRGLDPLGVQQPAINIYAQLLPGITNVTDRARYYSFYPWVIRTYELLPGGKTVESLRNWVRRCDCLFTMIGVRHEQSDDSGNRHRHATALTGIDTLRKPVQELGNGGILNLRDYTVLEDGNPLRYFKNPLGGLQQYYLGSFDGLGIMTRKEGSIPNTHEAGVPLAEAMDKFVNRDLFVRTIQDGEVSAERLDALAAFCPCQLEESKAEHEALLDLFFARKIFDDDLGRQRRSSLGLILNLIHSLATHGGDPNKFGHIIFRACVYSGALPDGSAWQLPPILEATRQKWRVYQKHELLSAAAQCIFWVALRKIEESQEQFWSNQEFMLWFGQQPDVYKAAVKLGAADFSKLLQTARSELPKLHEWQQEGHEIQLALQALAECSETRPGKYSVILEKAARVLLAVAARDDGKTPAYTPFELSETYFSIYPMNLESLRQHSSETWRAMSLADWLAWLAGYWGVEAHLRVALRKLRFQNKETLHVLPTDQGLVVQELPVPTYTTPRFTQGVQILEDIGVIVRNIKTGETSLTPLGEALLEETNV